MLFSEPKIPQRPQSKRTLFLRIGFQCSSASRKFLNSTNSMSSPSTTRRFSALQRAENSSTLARLVQHCADRGCFSALQRAENSSTPGNKAPDGAYLVFQCSSASRKFLNSTHERSRWNSTSPVSVLFSEPKIPQLPRNWGLTTGGNWFQCSSASRKFLNV